jgi:hypothetical protein
MTVIFRAAMFAMPFACPLVADVVKSKGGGALECTVLQERTDSIVDGTCVAPHTRKR